ncbi:hypothetical protein V5F53_10430 [Xanthobacter sp. V4C-4]|uniref:hypothetical protein n=1 Tax=Xanthobacter cornucopiae TaxID=3119924 RepID=UPI003727149E
MTYPYRSLLAALDQLAAGARGAAQHRHLQDLALERAHMGRLERFIDKNFRSVTKRWRTLTR